MRRNHGAGALLAGLFITSLMLRPQLVGVGPLLPTIQDDLDVSHSVVGLLPTIVVLSMGVFAPSAFIVAGRLGTRMTIFLALALIAVCGIVRAVMPSALGLLLFTLPVGFGVAAAGSLMPLAVKESWPKRPVFATGIYTSGISLGAALSAALAIPLAHAYDTWRAPLIAFSVATAVAAIAWIALTSSSDQRPLKPPRIPWRSSTGWMLVLVFTTVSIMYYGVSAWLPASFIERGWSEESAGNLLTLLNAVTVPASIVLASAGDRFGSRRAYLVSGGLLAVAGLVGVALAPDAGWLWAALIGISIGVLFPSIMLLPLDAAHDRTDVGAMAALMLGGGYTLSALAPLVLGALRDATGSFTTAFWVLVADAAVVILVSLFLTRFIAEPFGRRSGP